MLAKLESCLMALFEPKAENEKKHLPSADSMRAINMEKSNSSLTRRQHKKFEIGKVCSKPPNYLLWLPFPGIQYNDNCNYVHPCLCNSLTDATLWRKFQCQLSNPQKM